MKRLAASHTGFTLIELMIVVLIIGIIAAIGMPNWFRMQENAKRASCISNQRHTCEGALMYSVDNGFTDGVVNVSDLVLGLYTTADVADCPKSNVFDSDDYNITLAAGVITDITCTIEPARHAYTFQN